MQALHRDALGSIVASTDTGGAVKSETVFDAWGNVRAMTGASANKFGYTGHQMDRKTGLVYFQARYYDPEIGRFISKDPYEGEWVTPGSLHRYLYAYGNPTVYVDLYGYSSVLNDLSYSVGIAVGGMEGLRKGVVTAVEDGAISLHDIFALQFDNKDAIARQHQSGKDMARLLLDPASVKKDIVEWKDHTNQRAAEQRGDGSDFWAGFDQASTYSAVAAPTLASIVSRKLPKIFRQKGKADPGILPHTAGQPGKGTLTKEGSDREISGVKVPDADKTVSADRIEESSSALRRPGKSIRANDYPSRVRKGTASRLEDGATGKDGVIRCQSANCDVDGGRTLQPGEGTPEHNPSVVEYHNDLGYDSDQKTRNQAYNDTAKEWHCRECQQKQGGSTKETYRRDVGPNWKPRPNRSSSRNAELQKKDDAE